MLPLMQPVPIAEVPKGILLRIVGAAGAGFPSPAQDWQDDAISLIELLRLDRAASFVFRISGSSMIDAGIYDNDVVVVDRDTRPAEGHIVIAIVQRCGAAFLESRNGQQCYEPTSADGVEIWGVVRTGVRDYRR
ncbi:MAG: repressor [Sphingomonadales bacterium GWF1_63_6]|nr:MAG: repressor [Sphingomonadales bacterium GWF1_63_6]